MSPRVTRRHFLSRSAAWLAMLAGGSAFKFAWPARGSEKGTLRFVFYTDVHARQEWETPTALKMAAQAINRHAPDLVIAGGDLITDGFQSVPSVVMPRWEAYMQLHRRISSDLYPTIGNHDLVGANPEDGSPPEKNPRA
ncbi:MAG: metallophosphoesterase, partial [Desulfobacterales bacterium]